MMDDKKKERKKKKKVPFSLYLCLYQSLALLLDVYPYLSSLLLMKELEKKMLNLFLFEQDVVNSNVISLSVCFTCLYHTHLSLSLSLSWVKRSGLCAESEAGPS